MNRTWFTFSCACAIALALLCCASAFAEVVPPQQTTAPASNMEVTSGLVGDANEPIVPEAKGRLSGLIIGIDPGHQAKGNYDTEPIAPGSRERKAKVSSGTQGVVTKVPEYVVVLDISLQLRDALEAEGATVYMTRETADVDISNIERAVMMNEKQADLVLRIHCNAADSASPDGMALYVRKNGAAAKASDEAAQIILQAMVGATGARNRGVVHNDTYTGLNWSQVPSILVEMGFMTNPREDELLSSADYQQKLVQGMTDGIATYFGRDLAEQDADTNPTP